MKQNRKKKLICSLITALLIVVSFFTGQLINVQNSFAASDIGTLTAVGDSITRSYLDGQDFTFTASVKANYSIELKGPQGTAPGGATTATVPLDIGDVLTIYLGQGASAAGENGNGYGDTGTHKATVMLNETLIMVAGGGGATGATGSTGSTQSGYNKCSQFGCTLGSTSATNHYEYAGSGGAGGTGGAGGASTVTAGSPGSPGSSATAWTNVSGSHRHTSAGGTGGTGGSGGASYTNPTFCSTPQLLHGTNPGQSSITINMGEEILPPLDSKLILQVKKEILAEINENQITVVKSRPFDITLFADDSVEPTEIAGSSYRYQVYNPDKTDGLVRITGRVDTTGCEVLSIPALQLLVNVIEEPDSSNVNVVFN